jgi:uncharacterized protein (DUF362 family)
MASEIAPRGWTMAREPLTRAEFLRILAAGAGGILFLPGAQDALAGVGGADDDLDQAAVAGDLVGAGYPYMTVVKGTPIATNVRTAIAKLGGMRRFVGSGDDVIIKPNIGWARASKYAATTNPTVVATLVRLALGAGAARVRVMDNPVSAAPATAYSTSGIKRAVENAGGTMQIMSSTRYQNYYCGSQLGNHPLYRPMMTCDVLINVPIAKTHGSTGLTLAGKNMMGATSDRGSMHTALSKSIAEINSKLRPNLTVIDAIHILVANGPSGGDLDDVRRRNTIIASKDWVAADAYATRLFNKTPAFVPYIAAARNMGLGRTDLSNLTIKKYSV